MVGEPMDILLVFKNTKRIGDIMKGKFTMDTRVAVVPGPLGRSMKAATKEERNAEINSYIRSHGKFADVSVAATTVQIDAASNDVFYGKQKINAGDVLSGKVETRSDHVKELQRFLAEYAAGK
jgi:lipid-binding SYLF domain-containing protein